MPYALAAFMGGAMAAACFGEPADAPLSCPATNKDVRATTSPFAGPLPSEVSIRNTRLLEFVSKVNGRRYQLKVALPFRAAPVKGYGVLFVLDGNWYFGTAAEAVRDWNAPEVVVVSIGYPDDPNHVQSVLASSVSGRIPSLSTWPAFREAEVLQRSRDLTLPASDQALAAQQAITNYRLETSQVGGLDDFLKIIETEIKPLIAAITPIDPANEAIFGDSLGGLAVLHALFTEPEAFRTFIAGSPSIWWNKRAVLADERKFDAAVGSGRASPRVLITVGAEESTPPTPVPASWNLNLAEVSAQMRSARMVANARELVGRLKRLRGVQGYFVCDYAEFEKLDHGAASWAAIARGIPFAFRDTTP
jgi:uncharacterized protein